MKFVKLFLVVLVALVVVVFIVAAIVPGTYDVDRTGCMLKKHGKTISSDYFYYRQIH